MREWLAKLPSTNFRIFISVILGVFYVVSSLLLSAYDKPVDQVTLYVVGGFIALMMGLDVTQFSVKRATYKETPPTKPDIEDAKVIK